MSAYGLQAFDASGNLVMDTTTMMGGVTIDYRTTTTASATYTYPSFAGYTPFLVVQDVDGTGITLDTALGYPRVNVAAGASGRRFLLAVY